MVLLSGVLHGQGAAYTGGEMAGWMAEAGLAGARVVPLEGYSWLNSLVIAARP